MSKQARKAGQAYRRQAREEMKDYREQLDVYLSELHSCLKPRPRWCPLFIWKLFVSIAFDYKKLQELLDIPNRK